MKDIVKKMKTFIKERVEEGDILRYVNNFPKEADYNIYKYGNLDITYWECLSRLYCIGYFSDGINIHVLDELYPFLDNEVIADKYMWYVRRAVDEIVNEAYTKQDKGNI